MSTLVFTLIIIAAGGLIGVLGYFLFKGSSLVMDIVLGIAGAVIFDFIASLTKLAPGFMQYSIGGLLLSVLGALVFVVIYGFVAKRKKTAIAE